MNLETAARPFLVDWEFKIISGGQTGADRAALDWAIRNNVSHGGWCPKGRLAEDGPLDPKYQLNETPESDYAQRTEWNVMEADLTVIFSIEPELTGGSNYTAQCARNHRKPWLHLHSGLGLVDAVRQLRELVSCSRVKTLNVAGPRVSTEPKIAEWVVSVLNRTFVDAVK